VARLLGGRAAPDQPPHPAPPPAAPAAGPYRLTLEQARQMALSHNKSLDLARLNVTEKGYATEAAR
jgi:hypothetical protein